MIPVLMMCLAASACPFPTQFPEDDPAPNLPPQIDVTRTTPYYNGGILASGEKPVLTLWVNEPNTSDTLYVRVVKNLADSIDPESQIPPLFLLTDHEISTEDVPPGEPATVRSKQLELQVTPCPSTELGTNPVLTICVADRDFTSYDGTKDPCQPGGRDAELMENRGYTVRYTVVYTCDDS